MARTHDPNSLATDLVVTAHNSGSSSPSKTWTKTRPQVSGNPRLHEIEPRPFTCIKSAASCVPKKAPTSTLQRRQVRLTPLSTLGGTKLLSIEDSPTRTISRRPTIVTESQVPAHTRRDQSLKPTHIFSALEDGSTKSDDEVESGDDDSSWEGSANGSSIDASCDDEEHASTSALPLRTTLVLGNWSISNEDDPAIEPATPHRSFRTHKKFFVHSESSSDKEQRLPNKTCEGIHDVDPFQRPITPPPPSPSKSRLHSPSKSKVRIPPGSLRPSLDAFWTVDTVNEWNDQYSPRKVLDSPKKSNFQLSEVATSPTSSPRKPQSPSKRSKAEIQAKKTFDDQKVDLATLFLTELDQTITGGQISDLAASTGGVKLVWSKTLNSTAGRANWRRQTTKSRRLDGSTSETHTHTASIELAEKVIDNESRLLNVVAHEFCHLANFMVSGIKDQPHGRQFKTWGRLCTQAFGHRGVQVTTKHTYDIDYKYIWQCSNEDCGEEFKRHSKSIDPAKHKCGRCRSVLQQIKPIPRKSKQTDKGGDSSTGSGSSGGGGGVLTGYAAYVKEHFAEVKRTVPPGSPHKQVMEALGRKYRAEKQALEAPSKVSVLRFPKKGSTEVVDLTAFKEEIEDLAKAIDNVSLAKS